MSRYSRLVNSLSDPGFKRKVALGIVPGVHLVQKFFENPDIASASLPDDLWDLGGVRTEVTEGSAPIDSIVSSNALDTQWVAIYGIDADNKCVPNMLEPNTPQYVKLNGQTRVAIPIPLNNVWRIVNVSGTYAGTKLNIAGTVRVYQNSAITDGVPDDSTKVNAGIINGNNGTLMSHFKIPYGFSSLLEEPWLTVSRRQTTTATVTWWGALKDGVLTNRNVSGLNSTGSGHFNMPNYVGPKTPAGTLIKASCTIASADTAISGGYNLFLFDDNYLIP